MWNTQQTCYTRQPRDSELTALALVDTHVALFLKC